MNSTSYFFLLRVNDSEMSMGDTGNISPKIAEVEIRHSIR